MVLLNRLRMGWSLLDLTSPLSDRNLDFEAISHDFDQTSPQVSDHSTNFLLRIIAEFKYDTIIECGSYSGQRAFLLKRLFPYARIIGLDIVEQYSRTRLIHGVEIGPLDGFKFTGLGRALTVSVGTLPYMEPGEVAGFLGSIAEAGVDLAISEPDSFLARHQSVRRSFRSWYHPYAKLLHDLDMSVDRYDPAHSWSLSMADRRAFIYAKAAV